MPTDEERREVAARLREYAAEGVTDLVQLALDIAEAVWPESDVINYAKAELELADIIEPEPERTCRVRNLGGISGNALPLLLCSECGEANYAQANGEPWRYCPNCGARVKEMAGE